MNLSFVAVPAKYEYFSLAKDVLKFHWQVILCYESVAKALFSLMFDNHNAFSPTAVAPPLSSLGTPYHPTVRDSPADPTQHHWAINLAFSSCFKALCAALTCNPYFGIIPDI